VKGLQAACEENEELQAALEWVALLRPPAGGQAATVF